MPIPSHQARLNFLVCGLSGGGWQVPLICTCVEMGDMWGRAALSSGRVTCDTFAPDSSSSSPACGCESCKNCTTILVKTPHHRACVGIMCHAFSRNPSSSSEFLYKALKGVTPPILSRSEPLRVQIGTFLGLGFIQAEGHKLKLLALSSSSKII